MRLILAALALAISVPAFAETPASLQAAFALAANRESPAFTAFSADRGRQFFNATHGKEWSCATCHTADPAAAGKHATTGKAITPLAPSASPDRFTDAAKVDKWFRRNCNDVAGRACTAQEKGDILAWLIAAR
jgi:mono/diheme cytochrome c family protein